MSASALSPYKDPSPDFLNQWKADKHQGITCPFATKDEDVIRRNNKRDMSYRIHRPPFVRDIDKILHIPPYNRYSGKTQVFSFMNNDDISRRGLHVQLVARTARTIARALHLNEDLTEAIALGHDLGHTPFGHIGEHMLSELYHEHTGRFFNHNVHSVRILDSLYTRNISLQTLDGILCHNGESSQRKFTRGNTTNFESFDTLVLRCDTDEQTIGSLRPSTLEGCVVRISDMIAYVGKDRQDAQKLGKANGTFNYEVIGNTNSAMVNNLTIDIIEHSYMQNFITMSEQAYRDLKTAKAENYEKIYLNDEQSEIYETHIRPMFRELFEVILSDIEHERTDTAVYKHFINPIEQQRSMYANDTPYRLEAPARIATDYIASMTDAYFIAAHSFMCPKSLHSVKSQDYFANITQRS